MAKRNARLIIKNNSIPNAPFTGATLLQGEAIVNTADGIMMYSGVTQSTSEWTPAGTGTTANFFEVGSNLYDLRLRNRITKYESVSGSGLIGKFLSGTTNGFVLANISDIAAATDSYTTGATWNPNVLTLKLNLGKPDVSVNISNFTGLTVGNLTVTGNSNLNNISISGTGTITTTPTGGTDIVNVAYVTAYTQVNDVYVTGNTYTGSSNNANSTTFGLLYHGTPLNGPYSLTATDTYTTGGTYNSGTTAIDYYKNDGSIYSVSLSGIDINDTYVTAFTYSNNAFTIAQNSGGSNLTAIINTMTGLTVNGNLTVTGNTNLSGVSNYYQTVNNNNPTEIVNVAYVTAYTQVNDVYVTGNTYTGATNNTNDTTFGLLYHGTPLNGPYSLTARDTYTTGGTYNTGTTAIDYYKNDGSIYSVSLSGIDVNDTYVTGGTISIPPTTSNINGTIGLLYNQDVAPGTYSLPYTDIFTTGFTYNAANNTLIILDNNGGTLNASINTLSGISLSNLTAGRVVYVGSGGLLTDEAGFTYNDSTNTFSVPADGTVNVGTGGLNVAGSAVIQGSLTVFGPSISAFTTELYVEDPNVILNYNPTGSTEITSIGAGWTIQNGNGLSAVTVNDVHFNINRLDSLTGLTAGNTPDVTEYTAATGFANRGWVTELNDIVIRSTDVNIPNGVRVLAEFDIISGGEY